MIISKQSLLVALLATSVLAGCSANSVDTHASIVDHRDLNGSKHRMAYQDDDGGYQRPRFNHVSLRGDKSKAFLANGKEHFKRQNYGLAEESFRKAVEARSDSASAWLGLAASLDQLGKFEIADKAYEQLMQLEGDNARVMNNRGYSYLLRGDYQKARQFLNR
ncbi:MAG: tetratricopeptide repeat protein, partial [Pseudomonadota bacterium]